MNKIEEFKKIIASSKSIVFFGGAGVSTESNIPDFRSVDGLYNQKYSLNPEVILSHHYFINHTDEFFRFYRDKMIYQDAKPNVTHLALAKLEREGKLKAVITQNIDGLHQDAGSKNVLEIHGSIRRNTCMKCHKKFNLDYIVASSGVPICDKCGGVVKPDVVLYEEAVDMDILDKCIEYIENCDTLIIGGTSLRVYPAAGLLYYFHGKNLILINKSETDMDGLATLAISDSLGNVFKELL